MWVSAMYQALFCIQGHVCEQDEIPAVMELLVEDTNDCSVRGGEGVESGEKDVWTRGGLYSAVTPSFPLKCQVPLISPTHMNLVNWILNLG